MYDMDAPYPSPKNTMSPWLHWLLINVPKNDVEQGNSIMNYFGPSPPKDSPNHNYIINIYQQMQGKFLPKETQYKRPNFPLQEFLNKYGLKKWTGRSFESGYFIPERESTVNNNGNEKPGQEFTKEQIKQYVQNPKSFGYMMPGTPLNAEQQKVCRCVLHVAAKNPRWCNLGLPKTQYQEQEKRKCYSPYPVCVSSTGTPYPGCSEWYNFLGIPIKELMAYADLRKLPYPYPVKTPDDIEKLIKSIAIFICADKKMKGKQSLFCGFIGIGDISEEIKKEIELAKKEVLEKQPKIKKEQK